MASKAQYEAEKARRKAERDELIALAKKNEEAQDKLITLALDGLDRFVTAVERIADAMEAKNDKQS